MEALLTLTWRLGGLQFGKLFFCTVLHMGVSMLCLIVRTVGDPAGDAAAERDPASLHRRVVAGVGRAVEVLVLRPVTANKIKK